MKKSVIITIALTAGFFVQAVEIVHFSRPESAPTVVSRKVDSRSANGVVWAFSESKILLTHPTGTNGTVYGGMIATWSIPDPVYLPALKWYTHQFLMQVNLGAGPDTAFKGILLWNKKDFLNGANTKSVSLSANDTMSCNFMAVSASTRDFRFAVKQGDAWYVSGVVKNDPSTGIFSVKPASISWNKISMDDYSIEKSAAPVEFDDVQAVGLYMNVTRKGNQSLLRFNDFQANATIK
ncbi:MAG: hypothetical protein WC959_03465 [Kiritimatiellales bacterium]